MKSKLSVFIIGLITGNVIALFAIIFFLPKQMFVVNESKFDFEETLKIIEESAAENHWSIPHQYDLQATMNKNGFNVQPVKVISLCKPEHAFQILSTNNVRKISALMPCRVAVYEKEGKTYVSMLNAGLLSKFLGNKVSEVMNAASSENLDILEPVIKK